jgi:hypothetical protein
MPLGSVTLCRKREFYVLQQTDLCSLVDVEWPEELIQTAYAPEVRKNNRMIYRGLRVRMGMHTGTPLARPDPVTGRMGIYRTFDDMLILFRLLRSNGQQSSAYIFQRKRRADSSF